MEVDYSGFLQVLPDGSIWWPLGDAVKLGTGYQPMRDDHTDLVPVLRALNNRNVADERGLLSEFSPGRITERHPRVLERDGVRFVEAHEFLNWLWKYTNGSHHADFPFPHALARAVSSAQRTYEALGRETPPFQSLTHALEAWFDKPLDELPTALQLRVRNEFSPMPWDTLSGEQRHSVALQLDYQHDPATEHDQKFWWDFFERVDSLKRQLADWEVVATPNATELALKETRLAELKQELSRMDAQKRLARSDYYPERKPSLTKDGAPLAEPAPANRYVAYPKAMRQLTARLGATPEELAAWIWLGPIDGGVAAYVNANKLDPPPRFLYATGGDSQDYIAPLMACWFKVDDIDQFEPADRYITGAALIARWSERPGLHSVAFIQAKIEESRLLDIHPIYGGTRGNSNNQDLPPLETGLFPMAYVLQIEAEDFGDSDNTEVPPAQPTEASSSNWKLLVQAEAARRWKALRAAGANPTLHSIRDDLAIWCRKERLKTRTGINPSAEYIYRHVLRNWAPPRD